MSFRPTHISLPALPALSMEEYLDPPGKERLRRGLLGLERILRGKVMWHISSTAKGGGVAEMLASLLPYLRGAGIDARWAVIAGDKQFFDLTKRLHNLLHGFPGDQGTLGERERRIYEHTLGSNAVFLRETIRPGDVVFVHDPQPAGLCSLLRDMGCRVIWRCHIGGSTPNYLSEAGWSFISPYIQATHRLVFSDPTYIPEDLEGSVIQPSIDPASTKNQRMSRQACLAILQHAGLLAGTPDRQPLFLRQDSSPARVDHCAEVTATGPPPRYGEDQLIVQVARWDKLKDHLGVMRGFAEYLLPRPRARLILCGPAVKAVADDPEAAATLGSVVDAWHALPHYARCQIQLACLPMHDLEENAAIVNALQHLASVVVQKSLAEGFGLTATEAMWKHRAVLVSGCSGLASQVEDGVSGVVVEDPRDLQGFAACLTELLDDSHLCGRLGEAAHLAVHHSFLHDRQIFDHLVLLQDM